MTDIYPLGTTCATMGSATAIYSAAYDPWGNETTRTTGGVTGTLSYDQSNRMTEWNAGANSQEFYLYDATGNRILKRSITGTGTTLAVYSFGLEENDYSGTGVLSNQIHYYNLASHLIGSTNGSSTTYYMTDALDSVLTSFSQSAIQGEQVYGPFGASSYQSGTINTAKGYTGQVHDGVSGLDYYMARYYDPVMGMFLSVDSAQGNMLGFNPYAYASGNPETKNDPTGHWSWGAVALVVAIVVVVAVVAVVAAPVLIAAAAGAAEVAADGAVVGAVAEGAAAGTEAVAVGGEAAAAGTEAVTAGGEAAAEAGGEASTEAGSEASTEAGNEAGNSCADALSFRANTPVATAHGEQAIGTLRVGEQVQSYNPQTKKMELEPIQKVWLNHDNDLVDLTLVATVKDAQGKINKQKEVIHTNEKHPFLTKEKGFIPVSQLKLGMHVLQANGSYGVVAKLAIVSGAMWMYNLTVTQDHTYAVGLDQWIVHNDSCTNTDLGNKAYQITKKFTKAAAGAASNVTKFGSLVTALSGPVVNNIGKVTDIANDLFGGCCAETNIFAKIAEGLMGDSPTMQISEEDNNIIRIVVAHFKGYEPCDDCMANAQILANETGRTVILFWRELNGYVDPEGYPYYPQPRP